MNGVLLAIYFILGLLIGLIPALMFMAFLPFQFIKAYLKAKLNPGKYVLMLIRPYNMFVPGKRFEEGVIAQVGKTTYVYFPAKVEKVIGVPFVDCWVSEGYILDGEAKRELDKLQRVAGLEVAVDYINLLLKKKEVESMIETGLINEMEGRKLLQDILDRIRWIENKYEVCIEDSLLPTKTQVKEGTQEEYKHVKVLTSIDYDKIKECVVAINPLTLYYYSENLAHSLVKRFKVDNWFWIVAILALIIGGVIAYKMISG